MYNQGINLIIDADVRTAIPIQLLILFMKGINTSGSSIFASCADQIPTDIIPTDKIPNHMLVVNPGWYFSGSIFLVLCLDHQNIIWDSDHLNTIWYFVRIIKLTFIIITTTTILILIQKNRVYGQLGRMSL